MLKTNEFYWFRENEKDSWQIVFVDRYGGMTEYLPIAEIDKDDPVYKKGEWKLIPYPND